MSATILVILAMAAGLSTFIVVLELMPASPTSVLDKRLAGLGLSGAPRPLSVDELALQRPLSERVIAPTLHWIGRFILRRTGKSQLDELRLTILRAGSTQRAETLLAIRVILLPVGLIVGELIVQVTRPGSVASVVGPLFLAGLLFMYPVSSLRGKTRKRTGTIRASLPGTLDLLTISMEAGLSLDMAILRVCESDDGILGQEFQKTLNEIRLGRPRGEALVAMAERNDVDELGAFVLAVVQAEPLGVSVAHVLRIQSEELRRLRKQRAEAAGHRAPVLMLLPMMGCIFPCIFIILLGPAVLTIVVPH